MRFYYIYFIGFIVGGIIAIIEDKTILNPKQKKDGKLETPRRERSGGTRVQAFRKKLGAFIVHIVTLTEHNRGRKC